MKSGQVKYDSNPYSQLDEDDVREPEKNRLSLARFLISLSLFSYIAACIFPLEVGSIRRPGFFAIFMGIGLPMAWIPNPLYYIGLVLAYIKGYILAIVFALIACIWSIAIVFSGEFDGPAMFFWCMSMLILVIACFTEISDSKR